MNPLTKVSTLMTSELITVPAFTPIGEAKKLLEKHSIHHLPIVSPEGALEGILSHADFLKVVEQYDASQTVASIMSSHLAKLEPGDSIRTAANLFALNRFHALPVVDGDKLVGILTTLDLIRLMDAEKVELSDY